MMNTPMLAKTQRKYRKSQAKQLLLSLLLFAPFLVKGGDMIDIYFVDGDVASYGAHEYWTYWNIHKGMREYDEKKKTGEKDDTYLCISDYSGKSWYQDYIDDYQRLVDIIDKNRAHDKYMSVNYGTTDLGPYHWWYIRLKASEISRITINSSVQYP